TNPNFRAVLDWLTGARATAIPEHGILNATVPVARLAELAHDQSAANAFTLCWIAIDDPDAATKDMLQAKAQQMREAGLQRAKTLPRKWQADPKHKLSIHEWYCSSYA